MAILEATSRRLKLEQKSKKRTTDDVGMVEDINDGKNSPVKRMKMNTRTKTKSPSVTRSLCRNESKLRRMGDKNIVEYCFHKDDPGLVDLIPDEFENFGEDSTFPCTMVAMDELF